MSARTLAVTKLHKARSSSGKDISETGAILNYGSLSTCKLDLDSCYGMSECAKVLMFTMSKLSLYTTNITNPKTDKVSKTQSVIRLPNNSAAKIRIGK